MNIVFLGPPGSGKGTYASRIAPQLGVPHISTGDILRAAAANKTEVGLKAEEYMKKGRLVPDEVILEMVKERLAQPDAEKGFIFDGFPRTIAQADALGEMAAIDVVINLRLDDEIIIKKILARRTCEKCGQIYNVADIRTEKVTMPPLLPEKEGVCDKCGGKLMSRFDETADIIRDRLEVYRKQTQPLIDYYEGKGLLKNVEVVGPPPVMVPIIMENIKSV